MQRQIFGLKEVGEKCYVLPAKLETGPAKKKLQRRYLCRMTGTHLY